MSNAYSQVDKEIKEIIYKHKIKCLLVNSLENIA
jgi:hypothetical protein